MSTKKPQFRKSRSIPWIPLAVVAAIVLAGLGWWRFQKSADADGGAYRTQARLDGNNPDLYEGYPIRFGLNVNGALPGLFRSALFSGDFNRHILEQLQSGKLE